jgi:hypothetical protein
MIDIGFQLVFNNTDRSLFCLMLAFSLSRNGKVFQPLSPKHETFSILSRKETKPDGGSPPVNIRRASAACLEKIVGATAVES